MPNCIIAEFLHCKFNGADTSVCFAEFKIPKSKYFFASSNAPFSVYQSGKILEKQKGRND